MAEQKSLLTYICTEEGHNFSPIGEGYYKRDTTKINVEDNRLKDKVYRTILCSKCGEAKEICVRDNSLVIAKKKVARKRGK